MKNVYPAYQGPLPKGNDGLGLCCSASLAIRFYRQMFMKT